MPNFRSILERSRSRQRRRPSPPGGEEAHFATMIEHVSAGIAETDPEGRFVFVNQSFCDIVGRSREELEQMTFRDITHPDDLKRNVALFERMRRDGRPYELEKRYVRRDGSEVWVHNSVRLVKDEHGNFESAVGISTDITRRKDAERRAEESLRVREHMLFEVIHQIPTPMAILTGPELRFAVSNPSFLTLVGGRAVEHLPSRDVFPDAESPICAIVEQVRRTGERFVGQEVPLTMTFVPGAPRQEKFFTFVCEPLRDGGQRLQGVLIVAFEVTDQVVARRKIDNARREAETASRAKDEFLAMLGHELRNPLSPILTALQLMRLRNADVAVKEREILERQVEHLVRLVDDLLDVSRITRGTVDLKRRTIELSEVVAKAIELASPILEERRHRLHTHVTDAGLRVEGDPHRLAQIIANLLTNAGKYTEPGGTIDVSASAEGSSAVLRVRDSGIGIPRELLPHIFDFFVQGGQTFERSRGGLGLGLAIVKNLVAMHGGTVEAKSEGPGKGSEFVVRLPLAHGMEAATAAANRAPLTRPSSGRKILVVDDNVDAADLLAEALATSGHETTAAFDGPSALEIAKRTKPDIALLDIGLPVMDGYELARRLREIPGLETIRLVAVTGYGQASDQERARAAGFHEHLVKPVDLAQIERLFTRLDGPSS